MKPLTKGISERDIIVITSLYYIEENNNYEYLQSSSLTNLIDLKLLKEDNLSIGYMISLVQSFYCNKNLNVQYLSF